jgi:hypothetical protein
MRRWLLKIDDEPVEEDVPIAPDPALQCTGTGQVLSEFHDRSVFDLNAERARELAAHRGECSPEEIRARIGRLLAIPQPVPAAKLTEVGLLAHDDYQVRKLVFETEPGITVPGLLFSSQKADARGPLVVWVNGAGKAVDTGPGGPILQRVRDGHRVLALDLRGFGETVPKEATRGRPDPFGVDVQEAFLALHLDRPLLGQRVFDLLAVVARMADASPEGIDAVGIGTAGPIVLHAAALDHRIGQVTLERSLLSWSAVATTPLSRVQLTNVVPGVLRAYDLPDLAASLVPRALTIRQPVDPVGAPVPQAQLEDAYAAIRTAYEQARASEQLHLQAGPPSVSVPE